MNYDKLSTELLISDSDVTGDLQEELCRLREENARLKSLLSDHGIPWDKTTPNEPLIEILKAQVSETPSYQYTQTEKELIKSEKIALFRRLFRGRTDVYPVRWESIKGSAGYSPACGNEWKPGVCLKPRIKCGDCEQRLLLPVTDQVIRNHLTGKHTVGVYPLLSDDTCLFLAVDFDKAEWQENVKAFMQSCRELDIPAALEISRSGKGAHVWIFLPMLFRHGKPGGWARR